uniref:hypothetical protein n=1 Tax=Microbulbifer agarilyticus TaxID=260552 RepID=UPI00384F8734
MLLMLVNIQSLAVELQNDAEPEPPQKLFGQRTDRTLLPQPQDRVVPETSKKSFPAAKQRITSYISRYYSQIRPHQKNNGIPPNVAEEKY